MLFDKLFVQSNILETAMKASEYKNQVILNNIANADTPGFKGKNIEFKNILSDAVEETKETGVNTLNEVIPKLKVEHGNYKVRLDENNVDIETELVKFYKNSAEYDIITNSVLNNGSRLNTVFTNLK